MKAAMIIGFLTVRVARTAMLTVARTAMLTAACTAMLLTAACTASKGSDSVEMSTIAQGSYATAESRAAVLATSGEEFTRLWKEQIGDSEGAPAQPDFATGVAVFLMGGMHSSGGWSVEPQSVTVESDGTAVIVAALKGPPAGSMVTQALTSPYAVVFVRDPGVKKVRWSE